MSGFLPGNHPRGGAKLMFKMKIERGLV